MLGLGSVVLFSTRIPSASITDNPHSNKLTNSFSFRHSSSPQALIIGRSGLSQIHVFQCSFRLTCIHFLHRDVVAEHQLAATVHHFGRIHMIVVRE